MNHTDNPRFQLDLTPQPDKPSLAVVVTTWLVVAETVLLGLAVAVMAVGATWWVLTGKPMFGG